MPRLLDRFAKTLGYEPAGYASRFADDSSLATITLEDWLGALPDYVSATRANAMTISTVAAARNTIAGVVGRLPLVFDHGGRRAPDQLPSLLKQPEFGVPLHTTLTWTVDALFFYPRTWWHIRERDFYGWPAKVEWIADHRAGLDKDGRLIKVDDQPVKAEDVIRFDSPLGEGFLVNARKNIQRAIALDISAALAEDNPVPTVELHDESSAELTDDEITKLLDNWSAARRKRGVAYTPKRITVHPHGQIPQQLLIEGRRAISLDLIRQANLPAWAASTAVEGATMTYDNRNLRNWELIDLTLAPYMTAIATRLSLSDVTPRGWTVRFDANQLTQPDEKTRFETYQIGIQGGFIDKDWIAEREGWPKEGTK